MPNILCRRYKRFIFNQYLKYKNNTKQRACFFKSNNGNSFLVNRDIMSNIVKKTFCGRVRVANELRTKFYFRLLKFLVIISKNEWASTTADIYRCQYLKLL